MSFSYRVTFGTWHLHRQLLCYAAMLPPTITLTMLIAVTSNMQGSRITPFHDTSWWGFLRDWRSTVSTMWGLGGEEEAQLLAPSQKQRTISDGAVPLKGEGGFGWPWYWWFRSNLVKLFYLLVLLSHKARHVSWATSFLASRVMLSNDDRVQEQE